MKKSLFTLFLFGLTFAAQAQVVEDECPCGQDWAAMLTQETDETQVLMETIAVLTCEFPFSQELSESPIALLRPFMDAQTDKATAYEEFFYSFDVLISHGQGEGYLDENCVTGLMRVKEQLRKNKE